MKIQPNIAIPPIKTKPTKYPLIDMKIGDSFFVPDRTPKSVWPSVFRHAKKLGISLTMRTTNGGTRVWRTA